MTERHLKGTEVHYRVRHCLQEGDRIVSQLLGMLLILFSLEDFSGMHVVLEQNSDPNPKCGFDLY